MLHLLDVPSSAPVPPAPGTMTTSKAPRTPSIVASATPRVKMVHRMEDVFLGWGMKTIMKWFLQILQNVTPTTLTGKCCHYCNSTQFEKQKCQWLVLTIILWYDNASSSKFVAQYCPTQYSPMVLIGLCLYLVSFQSGLGPVPWIVNAEVSCFLLFSVFHVINAFNSWER